MSYWCHHERVEREHRLPLFLFLSGYGEIDGDPVAQATKHGPWAAKESNAGVQSALADFFRIAPHMKSTPGSGKPFWDVDLLREVVEKTRLDHADAVGDSLFVFGISRGGKGALDLVAAHGEALGVRGVVACCPEQVVSLQEAVDVAPTYVLHAPGDATVKLDAARRKTYEALEGHPRFRWLPVKVDGPSRHVCWPGVLGHSELYRWFARLDGDPAGNEWPDFSDLT